MKVLKFAAIDIGSNAVRLLLSNVVEDEKQTSFRKSSLIRMPIRLGEDAFTSGVISPPKIEKLTKTMVAYKFLMEVEDVVAYRACATSAMREAVNGSEVVKSIREQSGINIEIIDGKTEAEIIYSNQIVEMMNDSSPFLYVDVGGGSTEVTLFVNREVVDSRSFDIGTIRMLDRKVPKETFQEMKRWLKSFDFKKKEVKIIGSGGNINKIFKIAAKNEKLPLFYDELEELYKFIDYYTFEERVKVLGMNPDRADVIIPAAKVFLKVMKWINADQILVPTIGVSDGIVRQLYQEYRRQRRGIFLL